MTGFDLSPRPSNPQTSASIATLAEIREVFAIAMQALITGPRPATMT